MKHRTPILFGLAIVLCIGGGLTTSFPLTAIGCLAGLTFTADVAAKHSRPAPVPIAPTASAPVPHRPLLAGLLDEPPGPAVPPPADIDPDTGELLGDRVCRIEEVLAGMERSIEQLGNLMGEQSKLMANGLFELRRSVDQLEPAPHQQMLPLREAS